MQTFQHRGLDLLKDLSPRVGCWKCLSNDWHQFFISSLLILNSLGRMSYQLAGAEKYVLTIEHEQDAISGEAPARWQSHDL